MSAQQPVQKHLVVIVGGGSGGTAVAARLLREQPGLDVVVVDPATYHYYQPAWTLVGGGAYRAEATRRKLAHCLPKGVKHIRARVSALRPEHSEVVLLDGTRLRYEYLVLAAGIQLNWNAIPGLPEALGQGGVTSNYRYDLAPYTWKLTQEFRGGVAVFTQPAGAIKCPGAPQKALYLAADYLRRVGVSAGRLQFRSGAACIFGVPFYAKALDRVIASYGAETHYGSTLVEVRGDEKVAVFERNVDDRKIREEVAYDMLHVVPPQGPPDFIRQSALADTAGWLDVNKHSLRHAQYANVFGLGDCTSTPNSKTAAAIKAQAPVLAANLLAALRGAAGAESYDGYAACPLTTSRGKVLLAEFTYGGTVAPTLPLDPRVPRRFYWWLKRSFLPWFYWNVLLKGRRFPLRQRPREFPTGVPSVQP